MRISPNRQNNVDVLVRRLYSWLCLESGAHDVMIKIILYVDIAYFYRKANILRSWWLLVWYSMEILRQQIPVSQLQIWMETCIASCGLWAVAVLNICCVAVQDSRGCSVYEHAAVRFFWTDNLHLLDCLWLGQYWRRLTQTETAEARVRKKKLIWNWLRQQPHSTQVVHCLQIVRCWLWLTRQFAAASSAAISWWHYEQEMLPARFQETAQSEQHWHSDADMDYQQMYISFEYALRMGAKGLQWFNFFSLPKFTFSLHEFRVRFRV